MRGITVLPGKHLNKNIATELRQQPYEKDWGLVIGINDYSDLSFSPLVYSVNDAQSVYDTLQNLGFSTNQLQRLLNTKATKQAIIAALQELETKAEKHDRVFIFFAGHGLTANTDYGEEGFLMPVNGNPQSILETGISMKRLLGLLKQIPAKHILFAADSCYSGYAVSRGVQVSPNIDQSLMTVYTQSPVIQVLTAGQKNQQVTEAQGHGIFTKYLLEGLQGRGDTDGNGLLTALELGQWVQGQVIQKTERRQIPMFGTLSGEGQYLLRWDLSSQPNRQKSTSPSPQFDPWQPPLEKATRDFGTAYKIANRPRISVSFLDEMNGETSMNPLTTKIFENHFQAIGIRTLQSSHKRTGTSINPSTKTHASGMAELSISGQSRTTLSRKIAVEEYDFFFFTSQIQYTITRTSTKEVLASGTVILPKDQDLSALNREEASRQALETVGKLAAKTIQQSLHDYWINMQNDGEIFEVRLKEKSLQQVSAFQISLASDPQIRDIQRREFTQEKGGVLEIQYQGTQNQFIASVFENVPNIRLIQEADHQISLASN